MAADPGDWFEETLRSLRDQQYPSLQVVVIDAGAESIAERVAAVLPGAPIIEAPDASGYGQAVNRLLDGDIRVPYVLLCHDDVSLADDLVQQLVGESQRSDAAIVGPKLVHWDRPDILQHVGLGADKFGAIAALAEEGELDQQQHDSVADVFVIPSAVMLIRSEVLVELEGFDSGIGFRGEDLDLCWRALVAGERVIVAPDAVARHREALNIRRGVDDTRRLRSRHQLRSVLSNYGPFHLIRVLPQMVLVNLAEVLVAVISGRFGQARDVVGAWIWNLRRPGEVMGRRSLVRRSRVLPDREVRRFQERGSARFSAFVRGQIGRNERSRLADAGRGIATSLRSGPVRSALVVWGVAMLVLVFGSRTLLTEPIAAVGELQPFPDGPGELWSAWMSSWNESGLGSEGPAPVGLGILGLGGTVLFGAMGLLRTLLLVGLLPLGAIGVWRLLRPTGSRRARTVALVAYLATPIPYNALAAASWSGLIAYAATPWLAGALFRALGTAPYGTVDGGAGPGVRRRSILFRIASFGLLLALVGAFLPFVAVLVATIVVGMIVGSLVAGRAGGLARLALISVAAVIVAVALHLPWSLGLLTDSQWATVAGSGSSEAGDLGYLSMLRFETGPLGSAPLGWAYLAPALLVLIVGRGWRLAWGVRVWFIALASWALVWAAESGALPVGLPRPEVVLAPAAAAMAVAAGLSMVAFEVDVRRHRFGWRQLVPVTAALGLVVATLPVIGAAFDGDWRVPERDFDETLGFIADPRDEGSYRILWLGHPEALPLPSWPVGEDVAFATSTDGMPDITSRWLPPLDSPTERLRNSLDAAFAGDTSRLGQELGEVGVRYVLLPQQLAPEPFAETALRTPEPILDALSGQLDLERRAGVNAGIVVYEVDADAWTPVRASVSDVAFEAAAAGLTLGGLDEPALTTRASRHEYDGPVRSDTVMVASVDAGTRWKLEVDGTGVAAEPLDVGVTSFAVDSTGDGVFSYSTSLLVRLGVFAQAAAWIVLGWFVLRSARRGSTS